MSRRPVPQLSFADLQLQHLGVHLDPSLQRIADFLEQQADLVELVRRDLERGLKNPAAGRHGGNRQKLNKRSHIPGRWVFNEERFEASGGKWRAH